jgi:hypothetical protein
MRRSNCFVFALVLWWRWRRDPRAYLAWRRSLHITGLHWLVRHPRYDRWLHWQPHIPKARWHRAMWHKLWYMGRITRDDNEVRDA